MIAGMGILGAFALQIANLSGAIPVIVSDFDPARRKLALSLGATAAFSPDEENFVKKVKAATGGSGPNAVVEVTGSAAALQQALEYIAWEGRISLLGCTRVSDVPIDFYKYVHRRGISLIGAHTFTRTKQESAPGRWTEHDDYRTFLKLVAAGKLQVRPLISEIVSPEDATMVYGRLAEMKNPPLGIVFDWRKLR
jgi:threonine dehydrogenase-like Zn-dependent dehydrogenase